MSKEDMIRYFTDKVSETNYLDVEMVYRLVLGLTGQEE